MELKEIKNNLFKINDSTYLKKSKLGYSLIYPAKKDLFQPLKSGNINWKNLLIGGSWINFIAIFAVVFLLLFISWGYRHDMAECMKIIEDPYSICQPNRITNPEYELINLSEINYESSLSLSPSDNDEIHKQ
jgi:hypothetical protein